MVIMTFFSCTGNRVRYDDLTGKWEILTAERNGRETQTLQNVFFEFSSDEELTTNIFGTEETFKIDYKFPNVHTDETRFKELMIMGLSSDTLAIRSRIGDFRYDFDLLKSN
jgi:hypothetical protein